MISYYDLLGLIKEGKQPDKVKFKDTIYVCQNGNYYHSFDVGFDRLFEMVCDYYNEADLVKEKIIEIIEEKPKQTGEIEKLDKYIGSDLEHAEIIYKVNELIDRVNYLLGKDKHE